ncbi:hypothetical protein BD779DRAFT_1788133 [Infundibulicybe gibba]|nr:hypothetical protein BD779DRAFT_1788133 [Infundibulicybe gibba]
MSRTPTIAAVSPVLRRAFEDIRNHGKRDVKTVLETFLMLCLPDEKRATKPENLLQRCLEAVLPICNQEDSRLRSNLKKYTSITSDETKRYEPFVSAFNHALEDLKEVECDLLRPPSELNIMFHRNNPKRIIGTDGGEPLCKPDMILAPFDTVRAALFKDPGNRTWKGFASRTAGECPKNNFGWGGVLCSQEFGKEIKEIKSTLRESYKADDPCRRIDPQSLLNSVEEQDEDEDGVSLTEEAEESQRQASTEDPTLDSGRFEVPSPRGLTRLVAAPGSAPSSLLVQQQLYPSAALMVGGSSLGKRKRGAKSRLSRKRRNCENAKKHIPAMLRSASNAAEKMSRAFWVTHIINLVIVDDVVHVWYYDNEDSVQSFGINFIDDLPYFLVLLLAFQRFSLQNWGVMKELQEVKIPAVSRVASPKEETISLRFGSPESSTPELRFNLSRNNLKALGYYRLRGRCTQMLKTTSSSKDPRDKTKNLEGVEMVSKLYWPEESRISEVDALERARKVGETNEYIKGHLPDLIYTHDFDQYSTKYIRELFGIETGGGKRVLRWIAFRKLCPITNLVGDKFWRAFWECFRCHLHLWREGIRHYDISVSNLMYDEVHGRGILNDFDLAQLRGPPQSGTERTGTMPFMALELLKGHGRVRRQYRHDAESFAWVLLWICCSYKYGKEVHPRPLQALIQNNFQDTYEQKLVRVVSLDDLTPTASYSAEYYDVAASLVHAYFTRRVAAAKPKPRHSNNFKIEENKVEPDSPESEHDELADIDTELRIWRKELEDLGFHVDI